MRVFASLHLTRQNRKSWNSPGTGGKSSTSASSLLSRPRAAGSRTSANDVTPPDIGDDIYPRKGRRANEQRPHRRTADRQDEATDARKARQYQGRRGRPNYGREIAENRCDRRALTGVSSRTRGLNLRTEPSIGHVGATYRVR